MSFFSANLPPLEAMSAFRSLARGGRPTDATEFTPAQAEALIRRAIQLHDQRTDVVSLDIVRETLQTMGVAPAALERATAEVHAEHRGAPVSAAPTDAIGYLVIFLAYAWPGITLIVYSDSMGVPAWLPGGAGAALLVLVIRSAIHDFFRWHRRRALGLPLDPAPEAPAGP